MFLSNEQIKQAIADRLGVDVADLSPAIARQVPDHHKAAYQEVLGRLLRRGFSREQIDAWDRGGELEKAQAIYFCLVGISSTEAYDLSAAKLIDRRADLDSVQVFVRGEWVKPGTGAVGPGTVNHGTVGGSGACPLTPDNPRDIRW